MSISRWPKSGNVVQMISDHADTSSDWPTYPVKIVSQYYNTYKEAATKERQLFYSASASEVECPSNHNILTPILQKKRKYNTLQDDSDSSCNSGSFSPIKIKKSASGPLKTISLGNVQSDTETFQTITSALNNVYNVQEELGPELLSLNTNSNAKSLDQIEKEQHNNEIAYMSTNDMVRIMFEQSTTILAYVKRIDKKLETVGGYYAEPMNGNLDFLNLFPMKTVEAHQNIESKLADETFEKQMINLVSQIGGLNVHNFIKRVYARLYTNELATHYSWTGFRNNSPLQNLKLTKIVKGR
eukprot:XP_016664125.1 PREDICTED: uncharacterized protein LOC107885143 [Acyrthosiphon pisum]